MLNDWLPKQATSSLGMSPSRAPLPVAPVRPAHAPGSTSRGVSAPEVHGEPQLVRKPSNWMASNQVGLVQHGPTKLRPSRPETGRHSDAGRFSCAASGREGTASSTDADLEVLCGEAVLMAVFLVGLAWPIVVNPSR
jgi:hypothetical protein